MASPDDALVKNTEDEEQIARAGKTVRGRRARELNDLAVLMKLEQGRRFVKRMIDASEIARARQGNENALQYLAGKSFIGAMLLQDLEQSDPAMFVAMLTESRREKKG